MYSRPAGEEPVPLAGAASPSPRGGAGAHRTGGIRGAGPPRGSGGNPLAGAAGVRSGAEPLSGFGENASAAPGHRRRVEPLARRALAARDPQSANAAHRLHAPHGGTRLSAGNSPTVSWQSPHFLVEEASLPRPGSTGPWSRRVDRNRRTPHRFDGGLDVARQVSGSANSSGNEHLVPVTVSGPDRSEGPEANRGGLGNNSAVRAPAPGRSRA